MTTNGQVLENVAINGINAANAADNGQTATPNPTNAGAGDGADTEVLLPTLDGEDASADDAVFYGDEVTIKSVTLVDAPVRDKDGVWKPASKYRISFGKLKEIDIRGRKKIKMEDFVFPGMEYNWKTREVVKMEINYIDFRIERLIEVFGDFVPELETIYSLKKQLKSRELANALNVGDVNTYLKGAVVDFTRTAYAAGEVYIDQFGDNQVYKNDGYSTVIDWVELSDAGAAALADDVEKARNI